MGIVFIKQRRSREERARKVVQGTRQRIVLGADEERPSGAEFWDAAGAPDRPRRAKCSPSGATTTD